MQNDFVTTLCEIKTQTGSSTCSATSCRGCLRTSALLPTSYVSLSHSRTLSLSQPLTLARSHSLNLSLSHSLTLSRSRAHPRSHSPSLSGLPPNIGALTNLVRLSFSHSHSLTLTLPTSHSLTLSPSHALTLSLSYAHSFTLSLFHSLGAPPQLGTLANIERTETRKSDQGTRIPKLGT